MQYERTLYRILLKIVFFYPALVTIKLLKTKHRDRLYHIIISPTDILRLGLTLT